MLLLLTWFSGAAQNVADLKKQADKYFQEEQYSEAYPLYSQLVSNYPKDPLYNFRLGVCMIYSEPDKKKPIPFLKTAANAGKEAPEDVYFYLGKAYHINYLFDEAIKNYNEFKRTAPANLQKKLQVDREIASCNNGKKLLSNLSDLVILNKKLLSENDYFRGYDLKKFSGKLLVKPDEFKTSTDKKKKEKSVVFLPSQGDIVYFSSYGDNPDNGKDIYMATRSANGFSKPQKVPGINTPFDEDYPFLHPDGKTLYFASKGHNSMGGYDIFKSVLNENTNTWGTPVNMEFPINSPDDDYLFVTDSLEKNACFSTGRQSPPGKIEVLKIKTKRKPLDLVAIKGKVLPGSPAYSLNSSIHVKDLFTEEHIGTFIAQDNGEYDMELPNGAKLLLTIETPGMQTQSSQVSLPVASAAKPFRQTIAYDQGKLKVLNYFDDPVTDNSYLHYLDLIEKKARLETKEEKQNETAEPQAEPELSVPTSNPAVTENKQEAPATPAPTPTAGMSNTQLAQLARQDAAESRLEAAQLKRDALDAQQTGKKQKQAADQKAEEAAEARKKAETGEESGKEEAIAIADKLSREAEKDREIANRILAFGQSLLDDAGRKEKEAALSDEYADELLKSGKGGTADPQKIESLQKKIEELSSQKNQSESIVNSLGTEIDEKEKQITQVESQNTELRTAISEIGTVISEKETEFAAAKKKARKKELENEINDLKTELGDKEKQLAENESELISLKEEVQLSKNQLETAKKISAQDITAATIVTARKVSSKELQSTYAAKIDEKANTESGIQQNIIELNNYNRDIEQAIAWNNNELKKTTDPTKKNRLAAENKQLEETRKANNNRIAQSSNRLTQVRQSALASNSANSAPSYQPISASSAADAGAKLDRLDAGLGKSENQNFTYNGYLNIEAQNLKTEADAAINDAVAREKKLRQEISESKNSLANLNSGELAVSTEQLLSEATELEKQAADQKSAGNPQVATELSAQANNKKIQAAEITRNDNASIIAANQENIQNLIKENKSTAEELDQAKKLKEEASQAYREASDIRSNASTQTDPESKLSSYKNAEEKEAEAIVKQQLATETLLKANPGFALKTPVTSTSSVGAEEKLVASNLGKVNNGLAAVAELKIQSYTKLYTANEIELTAQRDSLQGNEEVLNRNPALKSEMLAIGNRLTEAQGLKTTSDAASSLDEKLSKLQAAVKVQNETLQKQSSLWASVTKARAGQQPLSSSNENAPASSGTNGTSANTTATVSTPAPAATVVTVADSRTFAPEAVAEADTTTDLLIHYFDTYEVQLNNEEAASAVNTSISNLKDIEAANRDLMADLAKAPPAEGNESNESPKELRTKADALLAEGEELADDAGDLRKQASKAQGSEKEEIEAEAREVEDKANTKLLEGATYVQKANEAEYKSNSTAIEELMKRLRESKPDLAEQLDQDRTSLAPLKSQITNLRTEAGSLSNTAAKLGAINNAEEKELELITKQSTLLEKLKKEFPDYVIQPYNSQSERQQLLDKQKALNEKQISELVQLINGFTLEFETDRVKVPAELSPEAQSVKQNAENLNNTSKELLLQAGSEQDDARKLKLLTRAAKTGKVANDQLKKLLGGSVTSPTASAPATSSTDISSLNEIGKNINGAAPTPAAKKSETVKPAKKTVPKIIASNSRVEGFEVKKGNAYSAAKPIPIDAQMESGLIFRVQIGAFRAQIPDNAFKGLSPLNGETTPNGYIRYTAGNFPRIENANAVKNDLRTLGYSDAFVVAYLNGKRISLAEAMAQLSQQGITVDPNAPQTAGITAANVPEAAGNTALTESVIVSKELEKVNGLLYTIQIGVYTRQVTKTQLRNLRPIFTEQLSNGLYRYTAGLYSNPEKILSDKNKVAGLGVKDAFISAYLNGKRIPFAEGRERQATDSTIRMESENPIIFPGESAPAENTAAPSTTEAIQPFTNNVTSYPEATPDNGIKTNEEGLSFKVQIGAFSKQVPADVAARFSAIRSWPVEYKQINGLYIYNVGNFNSASFAKRLKDELVSLGIADAFITVYRDGQKLYGAEAQNAMR